MTSILSIISGSFSRALLLGTFFPVTVFALLGLLFVIPFFPADVALLAPLAGLDPGWKMALVTLVIILATGLLYNLNVPLVRLFEGYPWQHSMLGKLASARQLRGLDAAEEKRARLGDLIVGLKEVAPGDPKIAELELWRSRLGQRVENEYPTRAYVLPTRLGNVIRSFEEYPRTVYGISTVSVWPRLVGVLSKEITGLLDESKSSFDFMINAAFLSGVLSAGILTAGLLVPERIQGVEWIAQFLLAALAARLFYLGSVGSAAAWGDQVKSAFDLFRWDLLKQLGYQRATLSVEEEQKLWREISQRMIYGNPPAGTELLPYVHAQIPSLLIPGTGKPL